MLRVEFMLRRVSRFRERGKVPLPKKLTGSQDASEYQGHLRKGKLERMGSGVSFDLPQEP